MILSVGNKVFYPGQGPCLISSVVEKIIAGNSKKFYRLVVLDSSGGELFVPVDKAEAGGVRLLLAGSEIKQLLARLRIKVEISKDWKQRAIANGKLFASGSAYDLAELVGSLTELSEKKNLSLREMWTLTRARTLMVSEISEATGETKRAAEEQVDRELKARKIASVGESIANSPFNHQPIFEKTVLSTSHGSHGSHGED